MHWGLLFVSDVRSLGIVENVNQTPYSTKNLYLLLRTSFCVTQYIYREMLRVDVHKHLL